jgi:hypothetical protein
MTAERPSTDPPRDARSRPDRADAACGAHMPRRRRLVAAIAALAVAPARAHHGWSSFDASRPLYLEGRVLQVRWANPHAELTLEVPAGMKLPADLARRPVPPQSAAVDGAELLARTTLPRRADRQWTVELAPLTRMESWKVPRLQPGDSVAVVGFAAAGERGDAVLRAEYLFVGGQTYGLRSSPAG